MGVTECDNMLMLLGISNKMTDRVRLLTLFCEGIIKTAKCAQNVFTYNVFSQSLKLFKEEMVLLNGLVHRMLPHKHSEVMR